MSESSPAPESSSFCWLLKDGRRLPLQPGENLLGRDGDGIQIDSSTVSRRHARIVIAGEEAVLDDLGSKNGTFVCGSPVSTDRALEGRRRDPDRFRCVLLPHDDAQGGHGHVERGRAREARQRRKPAVQLRTTVTREVDGSPAGTLTRNRCPSAETS